MQANSCSGLVFSVMSVLPFFPPKMTGQNDRNTVITQAER
jgi:hypothetical protein